MKPSKKKRTTKSKTRTVRAKPASRVPRFPTKEEFVEWWDEKEDERKFPRSKTCPIAQYFKAHGFPYAEGNSHSWYLNKTGTTIVETPEWAARFIHLADKLSHERTYRGLPEGFR